MNVVSNQESLEEPVWKALAGWFCDLDCRLHTYAVLLPLVQRFVVVLQEEAQNEVKSSEVENRIGTRCFLKHGNILEASSMDPFTHVFMFDIG